MQGIIFNIQRFSIHDGPGIRTTVFFKGCNLQCFWCHNPEGLRGVPEIQVFPEKCIHCGRCLQVCPHNAYCLVNGQKIFRRELCQGCGKCADSCYAESLVMIGKMASVEEVMAQIELDRVFYANSDGGVTFSGGEPMLQNDFLKALLVESKHRGFHTAIDTAGNVPWEYFENILPYTDLFLFDVKLIDEAGHQQATRIGNQRMLANLHQLSQHSSQLVIRIPVIPGVNATQQAMQQLANFLMTLPRIDYTELLNYHPLGEGKYASLGMSYQAAGWQPITKEELWQFGEIFRTKGIPVKVS